VPEAEREQAYPAIRASSTDVQAIARYQGLNERSVGRLRAIKEYLFNNLNFEADPEIANAWQRLRTGQGTTADVTLLKHETPEMWYRNNVLDEYRAAHAAANERWNWQVLLDG
jgi:hypothetical protein